MNKKESVPESIFGFILCFIFAGLIYNYFEYSLWRNLGIGFFILGGIGSIYEVFNKRDTSAQSNPVSQRYKTTIPKFTALKKFKNADIEFKKIKKKYKVIAAFYNGYKFNLYEDTSNYKLAKKQMEGIVNVVDKNLNEIAFGIGGSFLDYPMIISGMVYFKYVTKKRVLEVNNDLKDMHHKGELLDFDDTLMGVLESILGIK